jgi:guanine deaminase
MSTGHEHYLRLAIEEAERGAAAGHGGPFGAVVVRAGSIIASAHNQVTSLNDPTAHAEVQAIRAACRALGGFQLDGCEVYASCEPCPMCLGALYWARPAAVYFAATREDAAAAGFDDAAIYDDLPRPPHERRLPVRRLAHAEAARPFDAWRARVGRIPY